MSEDHRPCVRSARLLNPPRFQEVLYLSPALVQLSLAKALEGTLHRHGCITCVYYQLVLAAAGGQQTLGQLKHVSILLHQHHELLVLLVCHCWLVGRNQCEGTHKELSAVRQRDVG